MDPFTQGAVGAVAAQSGSKASRFFHAAVIGALGGMAPDLDVLIRSSEDPLLALEYHRQFTHSLLMIPVLGGVVGLLAWWLLGRRWNITAGQAIVWAILGYATHGLLDGCTSYGTQLLWPFSDRRFSWDLISVVDPLFTLPLLLTIALAVRRRSRRWVLAGAGWALLYLGAGFVQQEHALGIGYEVAASRGHQPIRLEAKPSFGNLVVWKVVYETGDRFYVDAVKPGLGKPTIWPGDSVARLEVQRAFPWLDDTDQQRRDIERFRRFSSGFVAVDPEDPRRIIDVRYSMLPHEIDGMWGIALSPTKGAGEHAAYFTERGDGRASLNTLLGMLFE